MLPKMMAALKLPVGLWALALVFSLHLQAQSITAPANLVFEGAGIRGIAYCGAIKALEEQGLLPGVQRVGGTSAGAITALLLALGYSGEEISQIIRQTSFKKFNDGRYLFAGGMHRFRRYYGWYRGKAFEKWISALIAAKTSDAGITFNELHLKGFKDLYVTGTSLTRQQLVVFSRESYPHMPVKDALRISMGIPLYFEAVFMDSTGRVFAHPKKREGLEVLVDGGFLANFPIRLFDSSRYCDTAAGRGLRVNPKTLGFRIDRDEQIQSDAGALGLAPMKITSLKEYLAAFYTIVLENLNRQTLTRDDWQRTVSISDGAVGPRIRRLATGEVERLVENGYTATRRYLAGSIGATAPR
ncbi:patatin-like phospholipase family protein [Paraflavisolibacter sp. H34]|uniref:patatin-like phospholipase family protein n=1 Tax=Huijunlia imazamoxiresistens TaxID=3127457 RepID=UPI00301B4905